MEFRERLLRTLAALQPVLEQPGVLVAGSEVPNLVEAGAASTLVVSEDVDIAVPVEHHALVKDCVLALSAFTPAPQEPSVWIPRDASLIEVKYIGLDRKLHAQDDAYVFEDTELPLMVFGQLSLLQPAPPVVVDGVRIPLPRKAGLALEKLLTERSGRKGDRDLLVVAGLLQLADSQDLDEMVEQYAGLSEEGRYNVQSNLTVLSLMEPTEHMPDPVAIRSLLATLLRRLEECNANVG